jgi:radical SAM superfamily enzyme YgiQ (UPF0313 family)
MKMLLLIPFADIHRITFGPVCASFREAPLTLTTLAALTPETAQASITLIDENVQTVPAHTKFDLVAISCLTGTSLHAYRWAKHFRAQGAKVVLGGIHVTLCHDEAAQHADAIMTGFAEITWPCMIQDFLRDALKPRYDGRQGDVNLLPLPRRDLQKRFGYAMPNVVTATRGCGCNCSFCSIPAADYGWQTRPIGKVIEEIKQLPGRRFTFNDVNLLQDREYALELLTALARLKRYWGGLATVSTGDDPELLIALQNAGCQYLLCGFESVDSGGLHSINKGFNQISTYKYCMEAFHAHGIAIQGCFIFGLDDDSPDIFQKTVDVINELKVDIPRFAINTPYPQTELYKKLEKEGRLLHRYWTHYDTQHVVFHPARMTPEELDQGFRTAYETTFRIPSILHRMKASPHPIITGIGNWAYRRYVRRLNADPNRIYQGTAL